MKLTALPRVDNELAGAFHYYQDQREGLGDEFLDEYRRGLEQIIQFPTAWGLIDDITRRHRLKRFPYGIHYVIRLDQILITTVVHLHSDPKNWQRG